MISVKCSGPRNAKLIVVGMAPATEEVRIGRPFVGPSGRLLDEALHANRINRSEIFVTNVCETPLPLGGSLFQLSKDYLADQLNRLRGELEEVKSNVILILGDEPTQLLTGKTGILKWRGSIVPMTLLGVPRKAIVSVHPAWLLRGMFKWIPVFKYVDIARVKEQLEFPDIRLPIREALTGPSLSTALDYIEEAGKHGQVSVDIEGWNEITCVGIGFSESQALCIPLTRIGGASYWSVQDEIRIWRALAGLLQNPDVGLIGQNLSYEILHFWRRRIYPRTIAIDTMLLHHCLYPDFGAAGESLGGPRKDFNEPGHGLAFQTSQYTNTPYYKDDGRKPDPKLGDHAHWAYNCNDVMVTYEVAMRELEEAKSLGLLEFYRKFYLRPLWHALRIEWDGVLIDVKKRDEVRRVYEARAVTLQREINALVGRAINVRSGPQMTKLLYEDRGYQVRRNKRTRRPTADKEALKYFAEKNGDVSLQKILEMRQIEDLISDVLALPLLEDNRIRTHYRIGGTDGARWSSSKSILGPSTNQQNIPRDGPARSLYLPG